jgi:energy-coupling factor transporter transmembrane protein EcfT
LLVPLIGHSLRHTRLLAMALESKGFGPGVRRYPMHRFRMRTIDYMVSIAMAVWAAGCIALRIAGYGQLDVRF